MKKLLLLALLIVGCAETLESEDEDTISHWQCDVIIPEFNLYPRIPDDTLSYSINIIDSILYFGTWDAKLECQMANILF